MQQSDSTMIMMPCSGKKLEHVAPAGKLYTGVMWQSLRVHLRNGCHPVMPILSAEYGFLHKDTIVAPYEQKMTAQRAFEMVDGMRDVTYAHLKVAMDSRRNISNVLVVGGVHYRKVMMSMIQMLMADGLVNADAKVEQTTGGIGLQRQQLGRYLDMLY
jgi:hypothetical protein